MTMGAMISSLRKEHGMTQAELAERMGVTDKAVSKWERDLSCPDISSLPRLAEVLEVSVEELVRAKNGRQGAAVPVGQTVRRILDLVLRAVALAMGVGVVALSVLKAGDVHSLVTLLGIGLACAGVSLLQGRENAE